MPSKYPNLIDKFLFRNDIVIATSPFPTNPSFVVNPTANALFGDFLELGFKLKHDQFVYVNDFTENELKTFRSRVYSIASEVVGTHVSHRARHVNFPVDVMNSTEWELLCDTLAHYFSGGGLTDEKRTLAEVSNPAFRKAKTLTIIEPGSVNDVLIDLVKEKLAISAPMPPEQVAEIMSVMAELPVEKLASISTVSNKEMLARVLKLFIDRNISIDSLIGNVSNVRDAMRVAAFFSGGDPRLESNVKFHLSRPQRRVICQLIDGLVHRNSMALNNMYVDEEKWKRLWFALRPKGFYKWDKKWGTDTPDVLFYKNRDTYQSWQTRFNKTVHRKGDLRDIAFENPGAFVRSLATIAERYDVSFFLTDCRSWIDDLLSKVSTAVVVQAFNALNNTSGVTLWASTKPRYASTKGGVGRSVAAQVLRSHLQRRDQLMGVQRPQKVYLDDAVRNVVVPVSQRNMADAQYLFAKGTRIPVDTSKANFLRMFCYRKYTYSIFVDLSVAFLRSNFSVVSYCDWRTRTGWGSRGPADRNFAVHSGDIYGAKATEFIDVDLTKRPQDVRYALMFIQSFSGVPFGMLEEGFAGVSMLKNNKGHKLLDPKTVASKMNLASKGNEKVISTMPIAFDFETNELIIIDAPVYKRGIVLEHIESEIFSIMGFATADRLTVGKLLEGRTDITLVSDPKDADYVLDDKIASNPSVLVKDWL